MTLRRWLAERLFAAEMDERVQEALKAVDDRYWRSVTDAQGLSRPWHEQRAELERIGEVVRTNPLAARLVSMTTDFVIGAGAVVRGHPWTQAFWDEPLNRLDMRVYRWCDELTRSGELFIVLSRNPASGMSYCREIPAIQIDQIETDPDDLERELRYHQLTADPEGRWWPGKDEGERMKDERERSAISFQPSAGAALPRSESGEGWGEGDAQIMLHYAINRRVGEVRGRSDLAPILTWLERYDTWLEDRVRINRYKGAYLWQVKIEGALPGQLEAKRAQYSRIPAPGSIIVTDGHETWTAVQPSIAADDVEADGKAIRLMIAAGSGVPLHFLAEGESATRATAREMGTATYRHFAHRQHVFATIVEDIIRVAARRAGLGEIEVEVAFESVFGSGQPSAVSFQPEGSG